MDSKSFFYSDGGRKIVLMRVYRKHEEDEHEGTEQNGMLEEHAHVDGRTQCDQLCKQSTTEGLCFSDSS